MVSIIIPVYNTEKYLKRCLDSVIAQDYTDWELILVDDGSTDQSGAICDAYSEKYFNIHVLHNCNQGPAASRMAGVEACSGDLVMFVDSDDWLSENALSVMAGYLEEDIDLVTCVFTDIYDDGRKHTQKIFEEEYIDCNTVQDCVMHMHRTRYLTGSPCTKLFRRELFEGINFHREVTIGEDYSMIVQIVRKARKVRMLGQSLYWRYVRKGSISHGGYTSRHRMAFDNYMRIRLELVHDFPDLKKDIIAFHTEYEMAVITAMCRNDVYDRNTLRKLTADLRENMSNTLGSSQVPPYMKMCALLIAYAYPAFIFLFRILFKMTGR